MTMPMPSTPICRPSAWSGADMAAHPERWLVQLKREEIAELEAAGRHFLTLGRDIGEITRERFPLPVFSRHLAALSRKLLDGVGAEVIRGLPVAGYSRELMAAIFCGIGAHLGSARSQNASGHILGHVRDTGARSSDAGVRIYQTAERQTFHTDSADVVGLICLRPAREGGRSLLVSAESIFNRLLAEAPDLLPPLFAPIATDRRGEVPAGAKPWFDIPVLSWHAERLTVMYQRQYIESAQRFDGVPELSALQIRALDAFDALANDPELHFAMDLQPGDMQFVYNHAQLHDRTGFTDWPEPERRRHLLRLWLSLPGDRELPDVFRKRFGDITPGNRGGIITAQTRLHAPLD